MQHDAPRCGDDCPGTIDGEEEWPDAFGMARRWVREECECVCHAGETMTAADDAARELLTGACDTLETLRSACLKATEALPCGLPERRALQRVASRIADVLLTADLSNYCGLCGGHAAETPCPQAPKVAAGGTPAAEDEDIPF